MTVRPMTISIRVSEKRVIRGDFTREEFVEVSETEVVEQNVILITERRQDYASLRGERQNE